MWHKNKLTVFLSLNVKWRCPVPHHFFDLQSFYFLKHPWREFLECHSWNCYREISPGLARGNWQVLWRMAWTLPTATIWTASGTPTDRPLSVRNKMHSQAAIESLVAPRTTDCGAVLADLMMGLPVTEDLYSIFSKEKEHEEKEKESQRGAQEQVSLLLQTYMQLLLPEDEKFHGGWALISCDMRFVVRPLNKSSIVPCSLENTSVSVDQFCFFNLNLCLAHQPGWRIQ